MRDRLVDDPDAVAALAARVASETGIPAPHIEKDFWVTEVVRGVVNSAAEQGIEVWFKGGTSLSKVFGLIERFSEDVDMLVVLPAGSVGAKDRMLKVLAEGASHTTGIVGLVDGSATTKGIKRSVRFHYRDLDADTYGMSHGVLLELGTRGGALGTTRAIIRSLIAEHSHEIAGEPEGAPAEVRVLAPWRTLAEKLVLLHTAHSSPEPSAAVRGARHFYDIHRLMSRPEVRSGVVEAGMSALARDVCVYSRAAGLLAEDRPVGGFASSPAFSGGPHIRAVLDEYTDRVVGQLLWPNRPHPSLQDCIEMVQLHADIL